MKWIYVVFTFLSALLISSLLLLQENSSILFGSNDEIYKMSVYLKKSLTPEEISKSQIDLKNSYPKEIEKISLISELDQMKDFQNTAAFNAEGLFTEDDLKAVLSPLLEITVSPETETQKMIQQLKSSSLVEDVVYGAEWSQKFREIRSITSYGLIAALSVFSLVTFLLLILILRLFLVEDKPQIAIWAIVGATPKFIFNKYSTMIISSTLISSALAYGAIWGLYFLIKNKIARHEHFGFLAERITFISPLVTAALAGCLILTLGLALYLFYRTLIRLYYTYEP